MKGKTHYEILGVEQQATAEQIKKAWKRLAGELHPDRNPGHDAGDDFRAAREAFDCLSDRQKRANYDELRRVKQEAAEREARKKQAEEAERRIRARREADVSTPVPERQGSTSGNTMLWALGLGGAAAATFLAYRFAPRDGSGRHRDRHTGQYRKGYFL